MTKIDFLFLLHIKSSRSTRVKSLYILRLSDINRYRRGRVKDGIGKVVAISWTINMPPGLQGLTRHLKRRDLMERRLNTTAVTINSNVKSSPSDSGGSTEMYMTTNKMLKMTAAYTAEEQSSTMKGLWEEKVQAGLVLTLDGST